MSGSEEARAANESLAHLAETYTAVLSLVIAWLEHAIAELANQEVDDAMATVQSVVRTLRELAGTP